jgi:hypothetical protein
MFCLKNAHPYEKCFVMWTEMYENYNMEKCNTQQIESDKCVKSACYFCDTHDFCLGCPFETLLGRACICLNTPYNSVLRADTEKEWKEACLGMILFIERAIVELTDIEN